MASEVREMPDDLADLRAAITALQFRVAEQESELTSLRGRLTPQDSSALSSLAPVRPMRTAPSDIADVRADTDGPARADRRAMLKKMGVAAAGVAMLSMLGTGGSTGGVQAATPPDPNTTPGGTGEPPAGTPGKEKKGGVSPANGTTGQALQIGVSNSPTNPTDTTVLINPSSTTLMDQTLRIDNFTNTVLTFPTARVAIVGLTSGTDTITRTKVGVYGASDDTDGYGVWGNGNVLRGVFGLTSYVNGAGVYGTADGANAAGVNGNSVSGSGGFFTGGNAGVVGNSGSGIGGSFSGGRASLRLVPSGSPGIPAVAHSVGDMLVDSTGVLFYCITAGTPGKFRQISGPSAAGALNLLTSPDRYVDTRTGFGGVTGQQPPSTTQTFQITGRAGEGGITIPDSAVAIFGTLTVIAGPGALPGSFLTAWQGGPQPPTSNINYGPSDVLATSFISALGPGAGGHGFLSIFNRSDANYLVDVVGYYA